MLRRDGSNRVIVNPADDPGAARLCVRSGFRPMDGQAGRLTLDL